MLLTVHFFSTLKFLYFLSCSKEQNLVLLEFCLYPFYFLKINFIFLTNFTGLRNYDAGFAIVTPQKMHGRRNCDAGVAFAASTGLFNAINIVKILFWISSLFIIKSEIMKILNRVGFEKHLHLLFRNISTFLVKIMRLEQVWNRYKTILAVFLMVSNWIWTWYSNIKSRLSK